jgi:hypothetical protein
MGFSRSQVVEALKITDNNREHAANYLLGGRENSQMDWACYYNYKLSSLIKILDSQSS